MTPSHTPELREAISRLMQLARCMGEHVQPRPYPNTGHGDQACARDLRLVLTLLEAGMGESSRSQPSADAGTHIPRSPNAEWVLVPREPTHEMLEFAWTESGGDENAMFSAEDAYVDQIEDLILAYQDMLLAAPEPVLGGAS